MKPIVITIESPIVAAYMKALIESATTQGNNPNKTLKEHINMYFPGGFEAAEAHHDEIKDARYNIWGTLTDALNTEEITRDNAPWLEATLPKRLGQWGVTYEKDKVRVGCIPVSLKELKLMVKKCEEIEENEKR